MSILIWGRRPKALTLGDAGARPCERCGQSRQHAYVLGYTLNHLYYVFGFVSGRRIACRCTICGEERSEVLDPALTGRANAAIPLLERFGCLGGTVALACLVLLVMVWSAFGPQPRNIPDLMSRVQRGDASALTRLETEAKAGDLPSQVALAQIYRDGAGVPADPVRGFEWARLAAAQGHPGAQFGLGAMYEWGKGTAVDAEQAAVWYRKAEAQGVAGAANSLGALYLQGKGVTADPAAATAWFRKAAEAGDVAGQFNLAMRYLAGEGTTADPLEARRWLELVASATGADASTRAVVASAKQELGVIYEEGLGVARDLVKALRYYDEARDLNDDARENFARLEVRLNG